jgi:hypothetical protein
MNTTIIKIVFVLAMLMMAGCKTPKFSIKQTAAFNAINVCEMQDDYKSIIIEIERVYPTQTNTTSQVLSEVLRGTGNSANRIDVTGQGFHINISKNQLIVDVPYYGEQQIGGSTNRNGINIKNQNFDLVRCEFEENNKYSFSIISEDANQEGYRMNLELFIGNMARVTIFPSNAQSIRYEGRYRLE